MSGFSVREHVPSILVASLSSAFGVSLLQGTDALARVIAHDSMLGASAAVAVGLASVAFVFIAIATYVGAVVTSNTFATIIAGRIRAIALMRLIGASARSQRLAVAREGLLVGAIGSVLGAATGTVVTWCILTIAVSVGVLPRLEFSYLEPVLLVPTVAVVFTTWIASWVGSRRVLAVSPMQAIGASHEQSPAVVANRRGQKVAATVLLAVGGALLVLGIIAGFVTPAGVLIGVLGGMASFTGVVLGSTFIMPRALRIVGAVLGSSAPAKLAAENALRYPERSSRTTIGIVIGVTLITMFAVAGSSFQSLFARLLDGQDGFEEASRTISVVVVVFSALIGFSALIAAVGLVNNLSLSVLQRSRELGLLRALGFTSRQLRAMIFAESAQLTIAAVLVGLVLGAFYGWAGAQSMLALATGAPAFVAPVLPVQLLMFLVAGAASVTAIASIAPSRRATRVSPVVALAVD